MGQRLIRRFVWMAGACVGATTVLAEGMPPGEVVATAKAFVAQARPGSAVPPSWQNASVGTADAIVEGDMRWYVCRLTAGEKPAGYVLLRGQGTQAIPVAYSGSALPKGLVHEFATAPVTPPAASVEKFQGPRDVLMVPLVEAAGGNPAARASAMASCLASVFGYLRNVQRYPLFDWGFVLNPATHERFPDPDPVMVEPQAVSDPAFQDAWKQGDRAFGDFGAERRRVESAAGLLEEVQFQGRTTGGRVRTVKGHDIKDRVKAYDLEAPLRAQYLLRGVPPRVRQEFIRNEVGQADAAIGGNRSLGMAWAYAIDHSYLAAEPSVEKAVERFFLSRGFRATCTRKPVSDVRPDDLPCVLVGPLGTAALLLGLDGAAPPRWALCAVPETVIPTRERDTDRMNRHLRAIGKPPLAEPIVSSRPATSTAPETWAERVDRQMANLVRTDDPSANTPASLDVGAHVVATDALGGWQALVLSKPELADNWGGLPVRLIRYQETKP